MVRLIPAHAGKTASRITRPKPERAHPRSRGENPVSSAICRTSGGSSPLTRGKPRNLRHERSAPGLIPAHAGKTSGAVHVPVSAGAHPRSRGENRSPSGVRVGLGGSSPLTRGKRHAVRARGNPGGLIPAHAGKTTPPSTNSEPLRAHPRSRGENSSGRGCPETPGGSSPLTRGKHPHVGGGACQGGLIPAHAGKTLTPTPQNLVDRAHPRSRGENYATQRNPDRPTGSSPLTRGKLRRACCARIRFGLIPAHAGKTWRLQLARRVRWAHPRSRGENVRRATSTVCRLGSSPLTRGKHTVAQTRAGTLGLIPAHAGKTRSRSR